MKVTLIPLLNNMLFQKTQTHPHTFIDDEIPSTSPQTVEQIRVIQALVLPKAFKLIDLVMNK